MWNTRKRANAFNYTPRKIKMGGAGTIFKEVNNGEFPVTDRHHPRNSRSFVIPSKINMKKITPGYIIVKEKLLVEY